MTHTLLFELTALDASVLILLALVCLIPLLITDSSSFTLIPRDVFDPGEHVYRSD